MADEKSVEELIALALLETKEETTALNDVEQFIRDYNVVEGNGKKAERVSGLLVYRAYKNWCVENNKKPIFKDWFFRTFIKYFRRRILRKYIKNNLFTTVKYYHIKINEHFQFTKEQIREEEILLRDSKILSKQRTQRRARFKERRKREKEAKRSEKSGIKQT